jgi:suppressor for copper-sensitivity B
MRWMESVRLAVLLAAVCCAAGIIGSRAAVAQFGTPGGFGGQRGGLDSQGEMVKAAAAFNVGKDGKGVIRITADVASGWHIYSITQAPGGPLKTKLKLTASPDFKLLGDFKSEKPAAVHHYEDIYPGLPVEEHEGQVVWTAPIEFAAGVDPAKLTIGGAVNAQVCAKECYPPTDYKFVTKFDPKLSVESAPAAVPASTPTAPVSAPASAPTKRLFGSQSVAGPPSGTSGEVYHPSSAHVTFTGRVEPATATQPARLTITADVANGWHIYALAAKDPKDVSKPTLIVLTKPAGQPFPLAKADSAPIREATMVSQSGEIFYHKNKVTWTVDLQVGANSPPGKYPIAGIVGFQTCDESSCDRPQGASFEGTLAVGEANAAASPLVFKEASYGEAAKLADPGTQQTAPRPTNHSGEPNNQGDVVASAGLDESLIAKNVTVKYSILELVLGAFFGGMILNLMPCVFPVIGLKILSFVEQSHHDRRRLLALNLWYTLGILIVFLGIAATAIVLRLAFNFDFKYGIQNGIPAYAIGMAAVMFVMGLSMLGVWEIPIPGFLGSGKTGEMMTHEGAVGAVAKGVITTLLGASCSGPLVFVAFAFALDRGTPIWATFGTFALIGLGMASPYLALGASPRLLKFLPKPGVWMDTFKQICGFILLGAMCWVLTWLELPYVPATVAFLVGLWAACWWIGRVPLTQPRSKRVSAWLCGGVFAAAVGYFAFTQITPETRQKLDDFVSNEIAKQQLQVAANVQLAAEGKSPAATTTNSVRLPWQPFSKKLLKELTQQRKTVMVDFTADWCANCKTLAAVVLNTADVHAAVEKNGVVPLIADYTSTPPEITEMLTLLKAGAIPVLAIFPANDPNNPIIFRGGYTASTLIEALQKAGPSETVAAVKQTAMQ